MFFILKFGLVEGKTSGEKNLIKIHERQSLDHIYI